jgi:hypothetical protein
MSYGYLRALFVCVSGFSFLGFSCVLFLLHLSLRQNLVQPATVQLIINYQENHCINAILVQIQKRWPFYTTVSPARS